MELLERAILAKDLAKDEYLKFISPLDQSKCSKIDNVNVLTPRVDKELKLLKLNGVRLLDIGYITMLYFLLGFLFAKITDNVLGEFDPNAANAKSRYTLLLEVFIHLWVYGITVYAVRNVVQYTPSPFHRVCCLDHTTVKELQSTAIFTLVYLTFNIHLREKLTYMYGRFKSNC